MGNPGFKKGVSMHRAIAVWLCLVLALATSRSSPGAVNLLMNPGFETGDLTGWTVGGTAVPGVATDGVPISSGVPGNVVHPFAGNYAAYATLQSPSTTLTLSQTFA